MTIYFDNSATTQPFSFVADRVHSYMLESYYNPSSLYAPSVAVLNDMQRARSAFSSDLGVAEQEILFTSGGSESNNTAIMGVALTIKRPAHFVVSGIEHASVYETCEAIKQWGHRVTYLPCDASGMIREQALFDALTPDTALVSVMHVNNEVGSIMDIAALAALTKQKVPHCRFHADGVQAYPKLLADMKNIDLYSISGHKFHAPRGVGVLMCKRDCRLAPIINGGGQEYGLRGGTENTAGIMGMLQAQQYYVNHRREILAHFASVKGDLLEGLSGMEDMRVNGPDVSAAAPHILSVSFLGVRGESLVHALEQKGIYAGTGSACSSHKKNRNRILSAMGIPRQWADGTVRFSFGCMNTREESAIVADEVKRAVAHLRRFQRR